MRLTKNDMARVVIQALYAQPDLPPADDHKVVKLARKPLQIVEHSYKIAHKILTDSIEEG